MPSRVIRGEILASDSLSRVSLAAEGLFWRMLIAADDYGRLDGRLGVLRATLFPARDVPEKKLEEWLAELDGDTIDRYEVGGRAYIELTGWERHRSNMKRGVKSRYPGRSTEAPRIPENPPDPQDPREIRGSPSEIRSRESRVGIGLVRERPARRANGKTDAPSDLSSEEKRLLAEWTGAKRPSLLPQLESLTESCLDWHRAKGNQHADWVATCRTWIRRASETREAAPGSTFSGRQYLRRTQTEDRSETTQEDRDHLARIKAEIAAEDADSAGSGRGSAWRNVQ